MDSKLDEIGDVDCSKAIVILENRLFVIEETAKTIVKDFYEFVGKQNDKMDWKDKSTLHVRARLAHGKYINIEWYVVNWYGSKAKANRLSVKTHISKPRDQKIYNLKKLQSHCQDWEASAVVNYEEMFAEIRYESEYLIKAITSIKKAISGMPSSSS